MSDNPTRRRLTTIFAADVVGYSRLSAADEEATLRRLKDYRGLIDRLIGRHEGRVFGSAGDSVLAEFPSAVEAVRCALTVQDELRVRNAELMEPHRMQFRIGINVGDVMVDGDNLLGDGVNVAARLESIAPAGGICISGSTFEQVKSKLSIGFEDIGPQEVKNLPYPVPAFRIQPAPVTVVADANARGGSRARNGSPARRRGATIAAAAVAGLAALGVGAWLLYPTGPKALSAYPENVSTADLRADDLRAFVSGVVVEGRRLGDDRPFKFRLNPDLTAEYELDRTDQVAGLIHRETGSWRVDDHRFCFRFRQFNRGREACPHIVKRGATLQAVRPNGATLPWTVTRPAE